MSTDAGSAASEDVSTTGTTRDLLGDSRLLSILVLSGVGVTGGTLMSPVLPGIQSGFAVSDAHIGFVLTAYYLPGIVLLPVVGAICDIYGRRRVALVSLSGFGLTGAAIYAAPTFEVLVALRFGQGICFAALTPMSVAYIGDFFRGTAGTTAQGLRVSVNGGVAVAAPIVAGVLAELVWNVPFLVYAVAFPAAVIVYVFFPEQDQLEDTDRSIRREFGQWFHTVRHSVTDPNLLLLILGGFILFGLRNVLVTIGPLLGTQLLDLRPSVIGLVFSLSGVVRVVVAPLAGRLAGVVSRKTTFVSMMGVVVMSMGLFAVTVSLPTFAVAIMVFSVGFTLFNPTLNDAVSGAASATNRGGVVGTVQSGKSLANTVSPAIAGVVLAGTDFRTVFGLAAVVGAIYVVVLAVRLDPASY